MNEVPVLMPVILATWEMEIRRILVLDQSRQKKVCKTPCQWKKAGCGVTHLLSSYGGKPKRTGFQSKPAWVKK
jgi:hypothetical protein